MEEFGIDADDEQVKSLVEKRVRDEIKRGVQTIQYQVVTLLTTNGQAPFVTVFMYLNEAKTSRRKGPCNNNRRGFKAAYKGHQK